MCDPCSSCGVGATMCARCVLKIRAHTRNSIVMYLGARGCSVLRFSWHALFTKRQPGGKCYMLTAGVNTGRGGLRVLIMTTFGPDPWQTSKGPTVDCSIPLDCSLSHLWCVNHKHSLAASWVFTASQQQQPRPRALRQQTTCWGDPSPAFQQQWLHIPAAERTRNTLALQQQMAHMLQHLKPTVLSSQHY